MKKIIYLLVAAAVLLTACEKEKEIPAVKLSITKTALNFEAKGGNADISLFTNESWKATSSESWCTVTPSYGDAGDNISVSVSCSENPDPSARNCTITITAKDSSKTINVSQGFTGFINIKTVEFAVSNDAQNFSTEVEANIDFNVVINPDFADWLKFVSTTGTGPYKVTLYASKNESYDSREGKVTIASKDGSVSKDVVVKQGQADALIVSKDTYDFDEKGGTFEIEVKHNIDYNIAMPDAEWIHKQSTKSLETETISFTVDENTTYDDRTAQIVISDKDGNHKNTITVNQKQKTYLYVSSTAFDVKAEGETIELRVESNTNVEVKIDVGWLREVSTKAITAKTHTFTVDANDSGSERKGTITITDTGGKITRTVRVYQAQKDLLSVSQTEFNVTEEGGAIEFTVESNIGSVLTVDSDWLREVTTKALSSEVHTFTVDANDTYSERKAIITVTDSNGNNAKTITVNQEQKDYLSIPKTYYEVDEKGGTIDVTFESNVNLVVDIDSDWVSEKTTKSPATSTRSFSISALPEGVTERKATIIFRNTENTISQSVTINQNIYITLDVSSFPLIIGESRTIAASVYKAEKTVTWTSSDVGVASVENGTVTGISKGTATITASVENGKYSKDCIVKVGDITDFVSAKCIGYSAIILNGLYQSGSQLYFGIYNDSPKSINVKSIQLYDGTRKVYGNVMGINASVDAGKNAAWVITVGTAGIYDPYAIFVYEYAGTEYKTVCSVNGSTVIPAAAKAPTAEYTASVKRWF